MPSYDEMYEQLKQKQEEQNKSRFNLFMSGLDKGLCKDLDDIYASGDMTRYKNVVNNMKSKGIKIFRNSTGKHKIKFN